MRIDKRNSDQLRKIEIQPNYLKYAEGSVLAVFGDTRVICAATIENKVPAFLRGKGTGWITAEYSMLPRSTQTRKVREASIGKREGRSVEIQRLIGRVLRSVTDLTLLGERTIVLDCDVIQADGGTRSASITGAYVAMALAVQSLIDEHILEINPIRNQLAAISVGMMQNRDIVLDLDYLEGSSASTDFNVVMTKDGTFAELQGTGEKSTFNRSEMNEMLDLAEQGIHELFRIQTRAIRLGQSLNTQNDSQEEWAANQLLIATNNAGKAKEFESMFARKGIKIKTLRDYPDIPEVEETGQTFKENALLKAETISQRLNMMVLADDSGLKVDALEGNPGVHSARYAGEEKSDAANNAKLLHELTDIPTEKRTAQFHCTLALAAPGKESLVIEGEVEGRILGVPRGENGFGYDPLFFVPELSKSMAELSQSEKNQISHRAIALQKLEKEWNAWVNGSAHSELEG